jgi:hypothetical protein
MLEANSRWMHGTHSLPCQILLSPVTLHTKLTLNFTYTNIKSRINHSETISDEAFDHAGI